MENYVVELVFDCLKCDAGRVYFYCDSGKETGKCNRCETEYRMIIKLEEVKPLDQTVGKT